MSDSFVTPWTVACQAPLSMRFSRQEYWSGFPFPSPGHLPDPGLKPESPALQADSFSSEPPGKCPVNTSVCIWSVDRDNEVNAAQEEKQDAGSREMEVIPVIQV